MNNKIEVRIVKYFILTIILWVSNAKSLYSIAQGIRHKTFSWIAFILQIIGLVCAIWYTICVFGKLGLM